MNRKGEFVLGDPVLPPDGRKHRHVGKCRWLGQHVASEDKSIASRFMGRQFGEIPGVPEGTLFVNRLAVSAAGVHRPNQAGICGAKDGAESVVVSGGYVDDADHGDVIVYTGQGGNDPDTKRQVADQELTRGNLGLAVSCLEGYPVRVIRGAKGDDRYSPSSGYRYDGLYSVVDFWSELGIDGYRIWRFRLEKLAAGDVAGTAPLPQAKTPSQARTVPVAEHVRKVHTPSASSRVKRIHDHTCQVCGETLETPAGPFAELVYLRPLGQPHDGPRAEGNALCVCPNHRVLFERRALYIDEGFAVRRTVDDSVVATLRFAKSHQLDPAHLAYHRELVASISPMARRADERRRSENEAAELPLSVSVVTDTLPAMTQENLRTAVERELERLSKPTDWAQLQRLVARARSHAEMLDEESLSLPHIDYSLAQRVARVLQQLVEGLDPNNADHRKVVAGAVHYFILEEDETSDLDEGGLFDDALAVAIACEQVGRRDLAELLKH